MENLYDYILDGLQNSGDFYRPELHGTFESYLYSLQEATKQLRQEYRKDHVTVDYSTLECQAAYLICYYPYYIEMTLEVFRLLTTELSHQKQIHACFFGSGPCPELVALVQFLKEHSSMSHQIEAQSYDIKAEQWTPARKITTRDIIPHIKPEWWQEKSRLFYQEINLCDQKCFSKQEVTTVIKKSNLFVFQNCLNELSQIDMFQSNIDDLLEFLPLNSLMIITDLLHNQNSSIKQKICEKAKKRGDFQIFQEGELKIRSSLIRPSIIDQYLLTGEYDLIPRTQIRFSYLVLQKSEYVEWNLDDITF